MCATRGDYNNPSGHQGILEYRNSVRSYCLTSRGRSSSSTRCGNANRGANEFSWLRAVIERLAPSDGLIKGERRMDIEMLGPVALCFRMSPFSLAPDARIGWTHIGLGQRTGNVISVLHLSSLFFFLGKTCMSVVVVVCVEEFSVVCGAQGAINRDPNASGYQSYDGFRLAMGCI